MALMGAPLYSSRWPVYSVLWDKATIKTARSAEVTVTVQRLLRNKTRYQAIEKKTDVPWWVIAALHERESGANFNTQLAQGDPLHHRSHNEPISGPFDTFEDSAVWALAHDHLNTVVDWRIEKALYWAETWNGWGYYNHHICSPYLWGATTVQQPGKYVSDGNWSSSTMDGQVGVAAMWKRMAELDNTIKFVFETPVGMPGDQAPPATPPAPTHKKDTSATLKTPPPFVSPEQPPYEPVPYTGRRGFWAWLTRIR